MNRHIFMAFLETVVFTDVVQIIPSDHNGSLHLHFTNNTSQNTTSDRNVSCEWAFLVNVSSINSLNIYKHDNNVKY